MFRISQIVTVAVILAVPTVGFAQTQVQVAYQLADGLRRAITGTEVVCPDPFPAQGGACFEANYTVESGQRLTQSIVGDLPGVRFSSAWDRGTGGRDIRSRTLMYRGSEYAVFVIEAGLARVMIMFLPW